MRNCIKIIPFFMCLCFPSDIWAHDKAFGLATVSFLLLLTGVLIAAPVVATFLKLLVCRVLLLVEDYFPLRTLFFVGCLEFSLIIVTMFLTLWLVTNDVPATLLTMLSDELGAQYFQRRHVYHGGVEFYHWEALCCWVFIFGILSSVINALFLKDFLSTVIETLGRWREGVFAALMGLLCPLVLATLMIVVFLPLTLKSSSHENRDSTVEEQMSGEQLDRLLAETVKKGNVRLTETLLNQGANVNWRNQSGKTLLMLAAWKGHQEVVKILQEKGADINARTTNGMTSLILAAGSGHPDVVEYLIKMGADIDAITVRGPWTALIAAAQWPSGSNKEQTRQQVEKNLQVLRILLDKEADVNAGDGRLLRLLATWPMLSLPNHPDLAEEYYHILGRVIAKSENINAVDESGRNALWQAFIQGNDKTVRVLAGNGADAKMPDKRGWTPLMEASRSDNYEMALILINLGADVSAKSKTGKTTISVARSRSMKSLLEGRR